MCGRVRGVAMRRRRRSTGGTRAPTRQVLSERRIEREGGGCHSVTKAIEEAVYRCSQLRTLARKGRTGDKEPDWSGRGRGTQAVNG